ncbi:hypothetical protein DFH09DRAFT_1323822 [Mycena vulgaris]|nr:hypothetical protein DFH09DRAFT_1323822 [Mycena vulgaris]
MHGPPTSDMMYRRPASTSTPVSAAQNPSNLRCAVANPDTTYPLPATDAPPAHQLPPLHATQNPQIFRCVPRAHQSLPARPSGFLIERRHDEFPPTTHHFWLQLPARLGHAISPHFAAINIAELKLHVWAFRDRPQHAITALAAAVAPQKLRRAITAPIFKFWIYSSRERGIYCIHAARQRAAPLHIQSLDFALPRARVHFAPLPPSSRHHGATPASATPDAPTITPLMHRRAQHLNFGFRVPASQVTDSLVLPAAAAPSMRCSPPRYLNSAFRAPASNVTSCPHYNTPALYHLILELAFPRARFRARTPPKT